MDRNDKLLYFIASQLHHNGCIVTEILRQLALTNCQLGVDISQSKDTILGLIKQSSNLNESFNAWFGDS